VDQELKQFLGRLDQRLGNLEEGQKESTRRFDNIDKWLDGMAKRFDGVDKRLDGMDKRFDGVDKRLDGMDKRFDQVNKQFKGVDKRFDQVDKRFKEVDKRFDRVDDRFNGVGQSLGNLEKGQEEIKDMLKHNTTLLTENFTTIRQDLRKHKSETDADINLLFKKTENNERDIEKIKKRLNI
jgi:archaellum component FlaC